MVIFANKNFSNGNKVRYESVEKACEKCSCIGTKDRTNFRRYILDCSMTKLNYILAGWPAEFGDNQTGTEIIASFSGNPIRELPQLPETDAVVSFSCRHCNITEIGSAVFVDVVNIKRVDLSWNGITGDELRVDVFRGRFSSREYDPIPLEELDLSHNLILTLERRAFEHIPHLKILNLAYNKFDLIDPTTMAALSTVSELTQLDLSYNHLKTLPGTFFHPFNHIRKLHIEGNLLETIPDCFNQLANSLKSLHISVNPIKIISADSLVGFKNLKFLNMSHMPVLKTVSSGTFAHLKSLEVVICKDNPQLETFDVESLKLATDLKQLDLSNCNLSRLNVDYEFEMPIENQTKYWQNLHKVRLSENPWECNCFMAHTLEGMVLYNNATKYSNFKARCATPYELAGTLLDDLTVEKACQPLSTNMQAVPDPPLEGHPFLRPKAIVLTIIASVVIIGIGFVVGFAIVMIRRKLSQSSTLFTTPIRYTTVRNSTMSTMSSATVE